jgi:hypothetical protein
MIDQLLVDEIGNALEVSLPGVFIGRMHNNEEVTLPAVMLQIEGEALLGSGCYRGTLQATAVSASADSSSADHAALCSSVDQLIRALSISVPPDVALYGIVATSTAADVDQNQFRTTLSYTVGYGPTS